MHTVFILLQVDTILRTNEYTHEFHEGSVKSYDSNQLASNNPIEDTRSEASCLFTTGTRFRFICLIIKKCTNDFFNNEVIR